MRFKTLELFGFKSFSNKTTVHFEPGVTAIVGPNGSGKSNLVDAIRWVLGEHNPRDVRAQRLEDIIFNGTDNKAPLSMAEVSLTIENEQGLLPIAFSEVQLTRRVYRSGESECFINQNPCRLKDIQELFLGTGLGGGTYAIIAQGHIDMILSSKPDERRVVFDEASGVARYLAKKQETVRRLDDVEQDLLRAADITQEVKRQLSALERQAARARHYKTQWEQLKGSEIRLAVDELRQGGEQHEALTKQLEIFQRDRETREASRQELLASLERSNAAVAATQSTLQDRRTRVVETSSRIAQHTSELSLKTRWIEELTQQREQLSHDVSHLEGRAAQLAQQLDQARAQHQALESQHTELTAQRQAAEQALLIIDEELGQGLAALEQAKSVLFEAASEASHQRSMLGQLELRLQSASAQATRLQDERRQLDERLAALREQAQHLETDRTAASDQRAGVQQQLAEAKQSLAAAQHAHHELTGRLNQLREQLMHQRAKVQLLEEIWRRYEGFPESVKTVLEQPPEGVLGLLVDVLEPRSPYEPAVAAALGVLTSAIVVRDREALLRCRELLASRQLHGVQFVVLSDFLTEASADSGFGAAPAAPASMLTEFVSHEAQYQPLIRALLGHWRVVDDIRRLLDAPGRPQGIWVSASGDRWDGRSWQFGGSDVQGRIGRKRQWEQAQQSVAALEQDVATLQQNAERSDEQLRQFAADDQTLRERAEELGSRFAKLDGQWQLAHQELRRVEDSLAERVLQLKDLEVDQRTLTDQRVRQEETAKEAEARQQTLETALKDVQSRQLEAGQRKQESLVRTAQIDASLLSAIERRQEASARLREVEQECLQLTAQLERTRTQMTERSGRIDELTGQLQEHRTQIETLGTREAQLQSEADQVAQQLREQETQRDQVMPSLLAVEQELMTLAQATKEQESRLAERNFRRSRILERLREVYQIDETQLLAESGNQPPLADDERQTLQQTAERLRGKLGSIGPVNLGSVEEYDELSKRLEFLQTQQQDLLKSRDDLKQSIQQINRTARAQFRETFAKIQQEFIHYFTRLFGGGQAELILMDEDDVLASGIEIIARPPGKRPQSISLLSGGERALTAIALLFALFKVRPSPFCILDEIDAPLDEANVDRFTRALEEFLALSQFILITHNKKTITKADCLYGVTMQQPGVSQIVSVKLNTPKSAPAQTPPAEPATPVTA